MKKNILRLFILVLTLGLWCDFGLAANKIPDYWPTNGWRKGSPESQGMDSDLLVEMLDTILMRQREHSQFQSKHDQSNLAALRQQCV